MCTICAQSCRSTCYPIHTNHYYEPVEHICKVAGWSPHPSLLVCHCARSLHSRCSIPQLWVPLPSISNASSLSCQRFVTYLSSKHFHLFYIAYPHFSDSGLFRDIWKTFFCAHVRVSFKLWLCNSAGENSPPTIAADCLNTGRKPHELWGEHAVQRALHHSVLTLQGGISVC